MSANGSTNQQQIQPASAAEMATVLGEAMVQGKTVTPVGGSTRSGYGNAAATPDWIVSTRSLDQILNYEPDDMTISVGAGVRLADIHATLAAKGQAIPIETWDSEQATIGGIASAALYGPRRFGSGTLRDYLIGIEAAYPNGTLAKAGGMVVKNVSGFDMMRMLHGSLGTLGIITSINLKVIPKARAESTVIAACTSLELANVTATSILKSALRPTSLEIQNISPGWSVSARFEGRRATIDRVVANLTAGLAAPTSQLEDRESEHFWSHFQKAFTTRGDEPYLWLRVRALPSESIETVAGLASMLPPSEFQNLSVRFNPALGSIDLKFDQGSLSHQNLIETIGLIRQVYPRTSVMTAPMVVRTGIDAFADGFESIDLMRRLKKEFDPAGMLNPGRLLPSDRPLSPV